MCIFKKYSWKQSSFAKNLKSIANPKNEFTLIGMLNNFIHDWRKLCNSA